MKSDVFESKIKGYFEKTKETSFNEWELKQIIKK